MLRSQSGLQLSALNDWEAKVDINSAWETIRNNMIWKPRQILLTLGKLLETI
jgi:hypothetical protein